MDYEAVKYVEGFVENIIYRNEENGYTVFDITYQKEEITCVGVFSYIGAGEFIAAKGEFVKHSVYDMQFSIKSYVFREPEDAVSVKRYLGSGTIKGIGEKLAESIVAAFGDDTFRIMEEEPERLAEIKGISIRKAMDIAEQVAGKKDLRGAMMFLQDFGISMRLAGEIYAQYGNAVYTIIRENPYRLADDIEGIGFKTADDIAAKIGIQADSDFRIRSAIFYVLCQAVSQGHVYLPAKELLFQVESLLLIEIADFDKYLMDLSIDKKIIVKEISKERCVYAASYYYMEAGAARMLADLNIPYEEEEKTVAQRIAAIEKRLGIALDEIQAKAVRTAAKNGLMILTGGPGTGKTTTINTIIKYFESEGLDIRLAAPTGRAAKRMTETCGYEAQTIHRLLEICGGPLREGEQGGSLRFDRNEENPLETDVIIVDEMSMVDIHIMHCLLKAVPVGTRLILAGDVDQLPSVGAGNVLKDMIAADCFPVVKLEKIFRQAAESEIITNAHKINHGIRVELNKYSRDFLFVHRNGADSIISAICTLAAQKLPEYVKADISEIQILTPSRKSAVGVERLNRIMQEYLNPPAPGKAEKVVGDMVFRTGDKVMQVKNNYQLVWEKRSRYGILSESGNGVFNGDTGVIDEINDFAQQLTVRFDDGRYVRYEFSQTEELELAYAITVHKSQGSEYPAVIIPMFPGPKLLMNRNILYTAVTRARKCVCMVGDEECFHQMEASVSEQKRYSSLHLRIQEICGIAGGV